MDGNYFSEELIVFWRGIYEKVLAGEPFSQELFMPAVKNFKSYWMQLNVNPIIDGQEVIGVACFGKDITDYKNKEAERSKILQDLIQNNQELLQFSYIVSHNLRGPVTSILGLINLSKVEKSLTVESILSMIHKSTLSLDAVICDLNEILNLRRAVEQKKKLYFNEILRNTECGKNSV